MTKSVPDDPPPNRYRPRKGFYKSLHSTANLTCVEVKLDLDRERALVRDSKYAGDPRAEPIIAVALADWCRFLDQLVVSDGSVGDGAGPLRVELRTGGGAILRSGEIALTFDAAEWSAFTAGVRDGEFTPVAAPL